MPEILLAPKVWPSACGPGRTKSRGAALFIALVFAEAASSVLRLGTAHGAESPRRVASESAETPRSENGPTVEQREFVAKVKSFNVKSRKLSVVLEKNTELIGMTADAGLGLEFDVRRAQHSPEELRSGARVRIVIRGVDPWQMKVVSVRVVH